MSSSSDSYSSSSDDDDEGMEADRAPSRNVSASSWGMRAEKEKEEELAEAAENNEAEELQRLLEEGVSPDAKNAGGNPAIYCAAESGHPHIIKLLNEAGANLEARDRHRREGRGACGAGCGAGAAEGAGCGGRTAGAAVKV